MEQGERGAPKAPTWGPVGPPPELWAEPDEIVALNVRRVRKLRGFSGRELEERAGLRGRYVSDLERGRLKSGPSVSEVVRIAVALSVSPLALVIPWHEGPDEQRVMYVRQGTFGVLFPGGAAGVEAAARLWSGRSSEAFAHVVNVSEFRTTLPSFSRDGDEHGAARVFEDGKAVELPGGTVWYPDERALRLPGGYRLSLVGEELGGKEWDGTELDETPLPGRSGAKVELLEEGPLFEQLRAAREGAEIDDEGGRS